MSKIDEELEVLSEDVQVARGQELMHLLGGQPQLASTASTGDSEKMDWNVVVKGTFIEVVMPRSRAARQRTVSDSALPCYAFEKQSYSEKFEEGEDLSDASTNVSLEAGDLDTNCLSSEGEGEAELALQPTLPFQCMESYWLPTVSQPALCLDQALAVPTAFIQAPMSFNVAPFVPMRWADHTMGAEECCVVNTYAEPQEWRSTVMIRNMPNNYTRDMFLEMVDSMGFAGTYDFAYLPVDFSNQAGLGYAFLNFVSVAHAQHCFDQFEGFTNWRVPSEKVCTVTWSSPTQGLEEHLERYRNSPVMHHSIPDQWKPVFFQQGMRAAFPPPTKAIKTPKVRLPKCM